MIKCASQLMQESCEGNKFWSQKTFSLWNITKMQKDIHLRCSLKYNPTYFSYIGKPYITLNCSNIGGIMGKYVTVSVKVSEELKEKMKKYGIKPSEVLKRAIEESIKKEEIKRLKKEVDSIKQILDKIPEEDIIRSIREDRENR